MAMRTRHWLGLFIFVVKTVFVYATGYFAMSYLIGHDPLKLAQFREWHTRLMYDAADHMEEMRARRVA